MVQDLHNVSSLPFVPRQLGVARENSRNTSFGTIPKDYIFMVSNLLRHHSCLIFLLSVFCQVSSIPLPFILCSKLSPLLSPFSLSSLSPSNITFYSAINNEAVRQWFSSTIPQSQTAVSLSIDIAPSWVSSRMRYTFSSLRPTSYSAGWLPNYTRASTSLTLYSG